MRYLEYIGGLGDIYLLLHVNSCYQELLSLSDNEHAKVVIASVNPYAYEIFSRHPNKQQLDVACYPHWWPWEDSYMRGVYKLPPLRDFKKWPKREDPYAPVEIFYDELPKLPPRYIVAQFAAGEKEKSFPVEIAYDITVRASLDIPLVIIGRRYEGQRPGYDRTEFSIHGNNVINLVDRLSVTQSIEVIRRSIGVIAPCSFPQIVGWLNRKPMMILYPPYLVANDITPMLEGRKSFDGCGLLSPKTVHGLFGDYSPSSLEYWLSGVL